jgi:hypothetical protein
MRLSRLTVALAGCLLLPGGLRGVEVAPVMVMDTPATFDIKAIREDGSVVPVRVYLDVGLTRAEMTLSGYDIIVIERADTDKMDGIFPQLHAIIEGYRSDPLLQRYRSFRSAFSDRGKFDLVGPEQCEGIACTRYNVTSEAGEVFYFWYDAARKVPVKIQAANGNVTVEISNFKAGHPPATLFQVPTVARHERYLVLPSYYAKRLFKHPEKTTGDGGGTSPDNSAATAPDNASTNDLDHALQPGPSSSP